MAGVTSSSGSTYAHLSYPTEIYIDSNDAMYILDSSNYRVDKAGIEKVKETIQGKKADEQIAKAHDPSQLPSERVDAALESGNAKIKEKEHACKSECHKDKHCSN